MNNTAIYTKKIEELRDYIFDGITIEELGESISSLMPVDADGERIFTVFISVCNTRKRTAVLRNSGKTLAEAWDKVTYRMARFVEINDYDPVWVKIDIMTDSKQLSNDALQKLVYSGAGQSFRQGLAFDDEMKTALLEAELNSSYLLSYMEKHLELERINAYLKNWCATELESLPEQLTVFNCRSYMHDGESINTLYGNGPHTGRRVLDVIMPDDLKKTLEGIIEYFMGNIGTSISHGSFRYGVLPMYHQEISGYSLLRHAGTAWSLICAYTVTKDSRILEVVEYCIDYMLERMISGPDKSLFVLDEIEDEVLLGPNALALLALTEYMHTTRLKRFIEPATRLAMGIMYMQREDGSYVHVLDPKGFSVKNEYSNALYDAQANFALARFYGLTGVDVFLNASELGVERFIQGGQQKYVNHWVSYCMNEITKYRPGKHYFEYGIKNLNSVLDVVDKTETVSPSMIELLCAGLEMYRRISDKGLEYFHKNVGFNMKRYTEVLRSRMFRLMDAKMWPEYAMYFLKPDQVLNSFFVREDLFRIRIDDLQHACSACSMLYSLAEKLIKNNRRNVSGGSDGTD